MRDKSTMIAESADVSPGATIGDGCAIWHLAQVREGAELGEGCVVGRGAYIDAGVAIGANCKIQNYALVYSPALLEEAVFIGPAAVLTNDRHPRATNPDGAVLGRGDWQAEGVTVRRGASIGARAVVLAGLEIGHWAMVGAGAVVTKDVAPHALVVGAPARQVGWVGKSGQALERREDGALVDPSDGAAFTLKDGQLGEIQ